MGPLLITPRYQYEDFFLPDCCSVRVASQRCCNSGLRRCSGTGCEETMWKVVLRWKINGWTFGTFMRVEVINIQDASFFSINLQETFLYEFLSHKTNTNYGSNNKL